MQRYISILRTRDCHRTPALLTPSTAPSAGNMCVSCAIISETCRLAYLNKRHHHKIITHCCLLFFYLQGHIPYSQTLSLLPQTLGPLCTTRAKDNGICCRCSYSCHQRDMACSTPFSTPVFPLCCYARHPKFTLIQTQRPESDASSLDRS